MLHLTDECFLSTKEDTYKNVLTGILRIEMPWFLRILQYKHRRPDQKADGRVLNIS